MSQLIDSSLSDEEFFHKLSRHISSCEVDSLSLHDLLAASVRLAKPNAYAHFNSHSYSSTVALINNLIVLRNAEKIAESDGRLSLAAISLALVSLAVAAYDAFIR